MSLDSIVEHILNEADSEAKSIIGETAVSAEKIIQDAKKEADGLYQEILDKERSIYENQKQKLIVNMRLESKKNLLRTKQELIGRVFQKIKSEVQKDKFKKCQVRQDGVKEVPEDVDFYLNNVRVKYESELAKVLFE